jgi:Bacterial Ig-like domain (group 2)
VLIACSTPEAPKVSSVTVSGPSTNALKLNEAIAFTAIAKDSSGTTITDKTFTWTSSDEKIATVDSSGKVTAKHFGTVTITASADGKSGESPSLKTYGLEMIGGTRVSSYETARHTTYLMRVRKADSSRPKTVTASITGPTGWNGGVAYTPTLGFGCAGSEIATTSNGFTRIPPLTGAYQATLTVDGETFPASFNIDTSQTLPNPSLTFSNASASSITGLWGTVTGAKTYVLNIYNLTDNISTPNVVTGDLTATLTGLTIDPVKQNLNLQLHVLSADLTNICELNYVMPDKYNVSMDFKKITF